MNAGIKHNRLNASNTLWGTNAALGVIIKKFGTIQGSYDKSYLPGSARNLLPVDIGRITYNKIF
jgi:hypothetical protein